MGKREDSYKGYTLIDDHTSVYVGGSLVPREINGITVWQETTFTVDERWDSAVPKAKAIIDILTEGLPK